LVLSSASRRFTTRRSFKGIIFSARVAMCPHPFSVVCSGGQRYHSPQRGDN
jgi:hypothetical protein